MENNRLKVQKRINKYNISIITIVILIAVIGLCIFKAYEKSKQQLPEPVSMSSVNIPDVYASIDVSLLTEPFAENDESECSFVVDKNEYLSVVVLSDDDIERLKAIKEYTYSDDESIEAPESIKIQGMTQVIPEDLKKIIIESYNELYDDNSLNEENFEEYMGNVYLNTKLSPINYSVEILAGILSGIFVIIYIKTIISTRLTLRKYTLNGSLEYIYSQLDQIDTVVYNKDKFFLTREYIVDCSNGLVIIKYDDIRWIYPFQIVQYGITTDKSIIIVDKDKKRFKVLEMWGIGKKERTEMYDIVYNEICKRAPNALKGYTSENKRQLQNM